MEKNISELQNMRCFTIFLPFQIWNKKSYLFPFRFNNATYNLIYTSNHPHCFNLTSDNIYLVCVTVTLFLWQHNWFDICGLQIEGNAKPRGDMLNLMFLEMMLIKNCSALISFSVNGSMMSGVLNIFFCSWLITLFCYK